MEDAMEAVQGGGTKVVQRAVHKKTITINGLRRRVDDPRVASGFALTHGVDADLWNEWLEANRDSDLVQNGIIFAMAKPQDVEIEAHKRMPVLSGLEEINPKSMPREFKDIETSARPS